jgi:plastocyanin
MKQRTIFTLLVVLFASILFLACSKSSETLSLNSDGSVRTAGAGGNPTIYAARISIENGTFNPASVTVMQSGTLLWVNNDNEQVHTVTADNGSFDSGDIQPGGTFSFTFNTVGPYSYRCKYHKGMEGLVKCVTK